MHSELFANHRYYVETLADSRTPRHIATKRSDSGMSVRKRSACYWLLQLMFYSCFFADIPEWGSYLQSWNLKQNGVFLEVYFCFTHRCEKYWVTSVFQCVLLRVISKLIAFSRHFNCVNTQIRCLSTTLYNKSLIKWQSIFRNVCHLENR